MIDINKESANISPDTAKETQDPNSSRIFNIVSCLINPITNEELVDVDEIESVLRKYSTIKKWAYIVHDKDVYTKKDERKNSRHKAGKLKHPHIHIVINTETKGIDVNKIAKWLKIDVRLIEMRKGKGAFNDCLKYLVHSNRPDKYQYSCDEVITNIPDYKDRASNYKKEDANNVDLSDPDSIENRVLYHGMTLKEVIRVAPDIYRKNTDRLKKHRLEYINLFMEMPKSRVNFYITGMGGTGKGLCSKALARVLIDPNGEKDDSEIFFCVGADKSTFEGYDGQPVLIWDDCRSSTLWNKLGGRENIFNVFDPYPQEIRQNVKFSSVRLVNKINIVNSVQKPSEFLNGLAGKYTDKNGNIQEAEDEGQSYRRFPLIIELSDNSFDLKCNKGVFEGTKEFLNYFTINNICGNFQNIAVSCGDNDVLRNEINAKMLNCVVEKYIYLVEKLNPIQTAPDEDIRMACSNYGIPEEELRKAESRTANKPIEEDWETISLYDSENDVFYTKDEYPPF